MSGYTLVIKVLSEFDVYEITEANLRKKIFPERNRIKIFSTEKEARAYVDEMNIKAKKGTHYEYQEHIEPLGCAQLSRHPIIYDVIEITLRGSFMKDGDTQERVVGSYYLLEHAQSVAKNKRGIGKKYIVAKKESVGC